MQPDRATQVRQGEELDIAQLQNYLQHQIDDFGSIVETAQFPGGYSNLTYLLTTDKGGEYVLRRPPFGANIKSGHDMEREFRVLSLLEKAGFTQIPRPLSMEASGEVLGAPFYVMQRLKGVILRANHAPKLNYSPEKMTELSSALVKNLAHLHALDIQKTGLITLGKPEGYVRRQVDGWIKRYQNSQTDDVPNMETVAEWMQNFEPRPQQPTFLHNDYKFDNVVWNTEMTEIIGVLDWEMSTVGDPLMDLGAALAYWCEPQDSDFSKMFNLTWLKGCLTRQEVVSNYAELTGRDVTDIHFYYIFGLYKNAVIMQQIYARWKKGLTKDPRFGGLIHGVFELSKMAIKAMDTEGV
ncbi:MAG: phosphotransferase family protein [Saprospiraceae bacterium]|nr:phosphotransferase family protein [Saprospiraceae bacterium]